MRGAEVLIRMLLEYKVEIVFGVPGDTSLCDPMKRFTMRTRRSGDVHTIRKEIIMKVVIVGGGWAGCAAAISATKAGG